MAYYEDHGADAQYPGRYTKNYDSGPVGPRRPSECIALCLSGTSPITPTRLDSPTDVRLAHRTGDRLRIVDGTMDANTKAPIPGRASHGDGAAEC